MLVRRRQVRRVGQEAKGVVLQAVAKGVAKGMVLQAVAVGAVGVRAR